MLCVLPDLYSVSHKVQMLLVIIWCFHGLLWFIASDILWCIRLQSAASRCVYYCFMAVKFCGMPFIKCQLCWPMPKKIFGCAGLM